MTTSESGSTLFRPLSVATWNMDHWRRTVEQRRAAWSYLTSRLRCDVALLQECVAPKDINGSRIVHRQIAGSRPWGSAVVVPNSELGIEEIGSVRTRYSSMHFPMLGTFPGATIVARMDVPAVGLLTFVSVYGLMDNSYAQTTMLRIIADLIPLFDSPAGDRVVLGGDLNVTTCGKPSAELRRYEAILGAVESLGLTNLAETEAERPPQLENCLCGAASCRHLRTFGDSPGHQLDWLFATPELASRCKRLRVDYEPMGSLSDHAPIIADFEIPLGIPDRQWDHEEFVREVGIRNSGSADVAEEIIAWAQRKHRQIRQGHPYASLDRLPISTGPDPELWVQLDLRHPDRLGWTISLTADGKITMQFQYMKAAPFDTIEARKRIYDAIVAIPGVDLEERLNGRPSFSISALADGDNRERFIRVLDYAVDQMVESHKRGSGMES